MKHPLVVLLISTACVACIFGFMYVIAEPPEFAQDADKPKADRVTHPTNKFREFAWWLTHSSDCYDVVPRGSWWDGVCNGFKRLISPEH